MNFRKNILEKIIFLVFILIFSIFFITPNFSEKEKEKSYDYKWSKAICGGNSCMDYLITCKNGEVLEIVPISARIVFSESWEDERNENFKEKYC